MHNISSEMCDFEDFYSKLAEELPDDCVIAEVGVADGYSALFLARRLTELGKDFKLYMIDSMDYGGKDQLNTLINNVAASGFSGSIRLMPYSSLDASCKFPDNHFDAVFVDASHKFEETKADIRLWYHKIKEDGLLAGHDYAMAEVQRAVNEVIPETYRRASLYDDQDKLQQKFQPEPCRIVIPTAKNLGVWAVRKKFYIKLN